MDVKSLKQVEQIKKLKARYFRSVDMKLWEKLADVFTEDATVQFATKANNVWQGRQQIVREISTALANATSIHHGHMPEIELTSEITATGIWAMSDYVLFAGRTLRGCGHYEEDYVKEKGTWKIKRLRLIRLREEWS